MKEQKCFTRQWPTQCKSGCDIVSLYSRIWSEFLSPFYGRWLWLFWVQTINTQRIVCYVLQERNKTVKNKTKRRMHSWKIKNSIWVYWRKTCLFTLALFLNQPWMYCFSKQHVTITCSHYLCPFITPSGLFVCVFKCGLRKWNLACSRNSHPVNYHSLLSWCFHNNGDQHICV